MTIKMNNKTYLLDKLVGWKVETNDYKKYKKTSITLYFMGEITSLMQYVYDFTNHQAEENAKECTGDYYKRSVDKEEMDTILKQLSKLDKLKHDQL